MRITRIPLICPLVSCEFVRFVADLRLSPKFCMRPFVVPGFSMSPFIHDGDVITLASAPTRVRFGDVVAFMNPHNGKLTVHRIVGMARVAYRVKGDNSPEEDGVIARRCILGRVTHVERAGRNGRLGLGIERVVIAFLSRRGWLFPVIIPIWRIVRPLAKRFVT